MSTVSKIRDSGEGQNNFIVVTQPQLNVNVPVRFDYSHILSFMIAVNLLF